MIRWNSSMESWVTSHLTRHTRRSMMATLAVAAALSGASIVTPAQASVSYTWAGPANGDWLTAANWSGSPAFTNDAGNVGTVNSGTLTGVNASNFYGQLVLNTGAQLNVPGYGTLTMGGLVLNGGKVSAGSGTVNATSIRMDAAATISATGSSTFNLNGVLSGSGDLTLYTTQGAGNSGQFIVNVGDSSAYTGDIYLTGAGKYTMGYSSAVNLGSGTVHVASTVTSAGWRPMDGASTNLELANSAFTFTVVSPTTPAYTGTITLLNNVTLTLQADDASKYLTLSGKITGANTLTLNTYDSSSRSADGQLTGIINNADNDYSGGTIVTSTRSDIIQVSAIGKLGTGNVEVAATGSNYTSTRNKYAYSVLLKIMGNDAIDSGADLYLDYMDTGTAYGNYGMLYLNAGVTITVANAYIGGTGGWLSPLGYTQLAPGTYTAANLPNYIMGNGELVVSGIIPEPTSMALFCLGGLLMLKSRRLRSV